uniref:AI-2E family transporter n=1 Tax=Acetatifactor sp. TaxID=1872090 RepID=UPI004056A2AD
MIAASLCFYYLLFHGTDIKEKFDASLKILMPITFGFVLAYLMIPILNYMEYRVMIPLCNKLKIKETPKRGRIIRGIGIIITVLLFFAIIYCLIAMFMSQIIPSISDIISNFDGYINNFITWLNKLLEDYPDIGDKVIEVIDSYTEDFELWINSTLLPKTSELIKTVSLSVIGILKAIWNSLLGLIISVYILASKEKFAGQAKKIAYAMFHTDFANIIINNFRFTHKTFIGFLSGKILDSFIIGLICFVGTSWLQTPYAALISLIVGVTNIIPVFGPYLGALPSMILIFVVDPVHPLNCLYFAIFILALQQFDGNVLGPLILGDSTGLAGFWVIFSITLFGGFFGVFGMLVGVPVFAVIYAAVKSIVHATLKNKNMPLDTSSYINVAVIKDDVIYEYIPDYKLKKNEKHKNVFGKEFLCNLDKNKMNKYDNVDVAEVVKNVDEEIDDAEENDIVNIEKEQSKEEK